jgi:two-component system chemotaxis response regulator CheB
VYGERALGLILTGMGQDGLVGCERLKQAGSSVIIQDQATSVVWGMPGAVSRAGLADAELPLSTIARVLNERLERGPQQNSSIRSQAS